ncbi:isoprenylcysteine carboxylmethyltransferase family protein [Methanosarcina sp. KYL-1]|uniref:methyltransferase family protein n=1 Tax=Methanosarcina sp. KYL-1 TaxID=2602068 RepID=UPI00210113A6|nr:isoprenylcysteine carboxylmethyltransferase family protein [Methanosarcina sp. KYL-1]MCQ1536071.1 isoprenylcysteine carboxylmethyltransferase family protein [Methanosarcina sp. KYL-1]
MVEVVEKDAAFWKAFLMRAVQVLAGLFLMVAVFFLSAGRTDLPRAWSFFGLYFVSLLLNTVIFLRFNPEVIRARSKMTRKEMKWWDKVFAILYILFLIMMFIVCGLDAGRFRLSDPGPGFLLAGMIIFVAGWLLVAWAMVENRFFETTVRIQEDREHRVVSTGPYAIIRHPGYAGMILFYGCAPFIIGSLYGLVPALLLAFAFVFRTHFEDRMLSEELSGYKEYKKKVRYRLVPFIW